jgi:hypothetical protein
VFNTSTLVNYLHARLEPFRAKPVMGLHSTGMLIGLPTIIRLREKSISVANTVTYDDMKTVTSVYSAGHWLNLLNLIKYF